MNPALNETEKKCASLLNTVDLDKHVARLDSPLDGTLEWVFKSIQYTEWISSSSSKVLWVSGYAGSGKTTLALYVAKSLSKEHEAPMLLVKFICDDKVAELRDGCSMLRSLIFQVVNQRKRLWRHVSKASDNGGQQIFERFESLWNIFMHLVQSETKLSMIVIIDAIDECEERAQADIIRRLFALVELPKSVSVKFLITSRFNPEKVLDPPRLADPLILLSFNNESTQVARDIRLVVRDRLDRLVTKGACRPFMRDSFEEVLLSKADATFLWIKLVLPVLEKRGLLLESDISRTATSIPKDLESLYNSLLMDISEDDRAVAAKLLSLIVAADRPLTADELDIMLTLSPYTKSAADFKEESRLVNARTIQGLLGSLVRMEQNAFSLVHQSLKDYLTSPAIAAASMKIFSIDIVRQHGLMASTCLSYLSLREFKQRISFSSESQSVTADKTEVTDESNEDIFYDFTMFEDPADQDPYLQDETWAKITSKYKLFDYAALYWAKHFSSSSRPSSEPSFNLARAALRAENGNNTHWFRYHWIKRMKTDPFPASASPLMLACFFGFTDMVFYLLETEKVDAATLRGAMCLAARSGQHECLRLILKAKDYPSTTVFQRHPLLIAAQSGHAESLSVLVQDGNMDSNMLDESGKSLLALAAAGGHLSVVEAILRLGNFDVNMLDRRGNSPLHWAVASRSTSVITLLLDQPHLIKDSVDKNNCNALSWAAEDGDLNVVSLLLKYPSISVNNRDIKGFTPLSLATQHGRLEAVKLLCQAPGVDPLLKDLDGRTPHSWAARQRDTEILLHLLKEVPMGADLPDNNDWTPLAWALDPPGYEENVLALLDAGVDFNRQDNGGRSVLSWVAGYGFPSIVKALLRREELDIDARDKGGRTALFEAATAGNLEISNLILQTGRADVNARDHKGRTPLAWATRNGHLDVVSMLTEFPGVDISTPDSDGLTPLDVARKFKDMDTAAKDPDGRKASGSAPDSKYKKVEDLLLASQD